MITRHLQGFERTWFKNCMYNVKTMGTGHTRTIHSLVGKPAHGSVQWRGSNGAKVTKVTWCLMRASKVQDVKWTHRNRSQMTRVPFFAGLLSSWGDVGAAARRLLSNGLLSCPVCYKSHLPSKASSLAHGARTVLEVTNGFLVRSEAPP